MYTFLNMFQNPASLFNDLLNRADSTILVFMFALAVLSNSKKCLKVVVTAA